MENFDSGVVRAWDRKSKVLRGMRKPFWWCRVDYDPLLVRQVYMMREGRCSLHNMIRGQTVTRTKLPGRLGSLYFTSTLKSPNF